MAELTVADAMKELREMFPNQHVEIRRSPDIWRMTVEGKVVHGLISEWWVSFHVPSQVSDYGAWGHMQRIGSGPTLDEAMIHTRAWKESQDG